MIKLEEKVIECFDKLKAKQRKDISKIIMQRYKSNCRSATKKYMHENHISFNECKICNAKGCVEIHHIDYDYPNLIIPLCFLCHKKQHSKNAVYVECIDLYD